jgi:hypothetical protein
VFGIEIEACARCHEQLKVMASIADPEVIARILGQLDRSSATPESEHGPLAACRAGTAGTVGAAAAGGSR